MKTRHKVPAVFSLYMVDVLCCALGCVILLWQLYHHESVEQTAAAEKSLAEAEATAKKLREAHLAIANLTSDIDSLKINLDAKTKKVVVVTLELDDTRQERDKAQQLALVYKQE